MKKSKKNNHPLAFIKPGMSLKAGGSMPCYNCGGSYQIGGTPGSTQVSRVSESSSSQVGDKYDYSNKEYGYNTDSQGNTFYQYRDQNPNRFLEFASDGDMKQMRVNGSYAPMNPNDPSSQIMGEALKNRILSKTGNLQRGGSSYPVLSQKGLQHLESKIDDMLGNPKGKASKKDDPKTWGVDGDTVDNARHSYAGRYTSEGIQDLFPEFAKYTGIPQVAGFVGANALGLGHELGTYFVDDRWSQPKDRYDNPMSFWDKFTTITRETGEDAFNNFVGAGIGSLPLDPKQKSDFLDYLIKNDLLPDGYGEKDVFGPNRGGAYFKNAKKNKKGGPIDTVYGQWKYPGQVTRIPSNRITMRGVNYPVLGVDDTGYKQMMLPGGEYRFPGSSVTEYPVKARMGISEPTTNDPYIGMRKFYDDAAEALNKYKNEEGEISQINNARAWVKASLKNPSLLFRKRYKMYGEGPLEPFSLEKLKNPEINPYHVSFPDVRINDYEVKQRIPTDYIAPSKKDYARYQKYLNKKGMKEVKETAKLLETIKPEYQKPPSFWWPKTKRAVRNTIRGIGQGIENICRPGQPCWGLQYGGASNYVKAQPGKSLPGQSLQVPLGLFYNRQTQQPANFGVDPAAFYNRQVEQPGTLRTNMPNVVAGQIMASQKPPIRKDVTTYAPANSVRGIVQKGINQLATLDQPTVLPDGTIIENTPAGASLISHFVAPMLQSGMNLSNLVMGDYPIQTDSDLGDLAWDATMVAPMLGKGLQSLGRSTAPVPRALGEPIGVAADTRGINKGITFSKAPGAGKYPIRVANAANRAEADIWKGGATQARVPDDRSIYMPNFERLKGLGAKEKQLGKNDFWTNEELNDYLRKSMEQSKTVDRLYDSHYEFAKRAGLTDASNYSPAELNELFPNLKAEWDNAMEPFKNLGKLNQKALTPEQIRVIENNFSKLPQDIRDMFNVDGGRAEFLRGLNQAANYPYQKNKAVLDWLPNPYLRTEFNPQTFEFTEPGFKLTGFYPGQMNKYGGATTKQKESSVTWKIIK